MASLPQPLLLAPFFIFPAASGWVCPASAGSAVVRGGHTASAPHTKPRLPFTARRRGPGDAGGLRRSPPRRDLSPPLFLAKLLLPSALAPVITPRHREEAAPLVPSPGRAGGGPRAGGPRHRAAANSVRPPTIRTARRDQ